eukprot:tig00000383_g24623.t1
MATCTGATAPATGPSVLDKSAVLKWKAPEVLAWFADVFSLAPATPACRVLEQLALTGRMLLLRSASDLEPELLEMLQEIPEADKREKKALDNLVAELVVEAEEACVEAGAREAIQRVYARRK